MIRDLIASQIAKHSLPVESGCVLWTGATVGRGYPIARWKDEQISVRRVVWEVSRGVILRPRQLVVMTCHNSKCVGPEHMKLGGYADAYRPGSTTNLGTKNGQAKLDEPRVREMRALRVNGESVAALAARFSVTQACVSKVLARKTWAHLEN